jgi:pyruvate/2-oxoglutarate/acetoin dehydrogenase E1 component
LAQEKLGVGCEIIDLVSVLPWDQDTINQSVLKTGRCIVSHEAPLTNGFGAELAASIQVNLDFKIDVTRFQFDGIYTTQLTRRCVVPKG